MVFEGPKVFPKVKNGQKKCPKMGKGDILQSFHLIFFVCDANGLKLILSLKNIVTINFLDIFWKTI